MLRYTLASTLYTDNFEVHVQVALVSDRTQTLVPWLRYPDPEKDSNASIGTLAQAH